MYSYTKRKAVNAKGRTGREQDSQIHTHTHTHTNKQIYIGTYTTETFTQTMSDYGTYTNNAQMNRNILITTHQKFQHVDRFHHMLVTYPITWQMQGAGVGVAAFGSGARGSVKRDRRYVYLAETWKGWSV